MIDLQITGGIAWLTLNRPAKLNALDRATVAALAECLDEIGEREDVRVVVTRGAGRAYCAGSDLSDLAPLTAAEAGVLEAEHAAVCARLDGLPQPTVAMLHGYVLGGGLGLAVYHDFRIAAADATLGMPEIELGWTPPWAMGRLVDVVGPTQARWIALAAMRLTGVQAAAIGLVNEAVDEGELLNRVTGHARRLAALSPTAVAETKALINRMAPLRRPEWDDQANAAFQKCWETPEAKERIRMFLDRRR
jgi:enoyl-CoA hydratase